MTFLIADTFTDSLARLTGDEQKAAKTTAFDLQMDPSAPGLSFHRLDKAKDKRFWSVRVNADVRLIVHRTDRQPSALLRRSSRPRLRVGGAQKAGDAPNDRRRTNHRAAASRSAKSSSRRTCRRRNRRRPRRSRWPRCLTTPLLGYGVPAEWLVDVREADEDGLLALAGHLPAEAAEAVLELATGGTPQVAKPEPSAVSEPLAPFTHPDAQRRFRVVTSVEELERALDAPWDKWAVFLHPEQRQLVTRVYSGPARVAGSAGTGKTVVALHRAVHLARATPDGRILLATFSDPLAHALRANVKRLIGNEPRVMERLEVHSMSALGLRLHQAQLGPVRLASTDDVDALLREASTTAGDHKFSAAFLRTEWRSSCRCVAACAPGRHIAMFSVLAVEHAFPKRGVPCCGRSSSTCEPA